MYHEDSQHFECDECKIYILKNQPVILDGYRHFCTEECKRTWQDKREEDIRWEEEAQFVIGPCTD